MKARVHIFVSGRVQGVLFRANTSKKAKEFGLTGWVKNLSDGNVEAIFEGDEEAAAKMIEWVKRGPFLAKVENVEVRKEEYQGEFNDFETR